MLPKAFQNLCCESSSDLRGFDPGADAFMKTRKAQSRFPSSPHERAWFLTRPLVFGRQSNLLFISSTLWNDDYTILMKDHWSGETGASWHFFG